VLRASVRPVMCNPFIAGVNTFMGRPPGRIQDRPFQMRLSAEFLERLDEWRLKQQETPSRAEAIRRLTTGMLQTLHNKPSDKPRKTPFSPMISLFDSNLHGQLMRPAQCRAARGLLNWTQHQMASAAHMSPVTVRNFENEKSTPQRATLDVMQRTFEAAGIEFTNGQRPGVRLTKAPAPHSAERASASNPAVAAKAARRKTAKATGKEQ
jgi:transcriptional regulator with XRE-family HTH domain